MRFHQSYLCSSLALAVGMAFAMPSTAVAQDAEGAEDAGYGEIVVTAQRREEKLQEVPLAITAATGEDLANHGTTDLRGISQVAPSLNIMVYPNSSDTVSLTMRGQGVADAGQITKDGGVGLYVDGFYISRPQAALLDLGDPERIEVLRGPQGTLYGRNTTGGAVNIISSKPTGEWGGSASLTYGSRNLVRGLATVNLPMIGDQLAIKGTILFTEQDGYVKNFGSLRDYHESGQLAGRVAARWTPTDTLTIDYAFDRGRVVSTQPYYINPDLVGLVNPDTGPFGQVFAGYSADKDHTYTALDIGQSRAHFTDHQLTISWDVTDNLTIRSLSAFRKTRAFQDANYGLAQSYPILYLTDAQWAGIYGASIPNMSFNGDLVAESQAWYRAKQWTQEFQLIGSIGDYVEYTGGLYYFKEKGSHQSDVQAYASQFFYPDPASLSQQYVEATSISKAAYLQVTLTPPVLDERLKLTLGGRYTEDKRRATRDRWYYLYSVPGYVQIENGVTNSQKFTNFSPSVNLAMQWTPDLMTYVRYSKGYKAGGSGESAPNFATATFGPEKVEAWEAGLKSQFLDRKVTFNASVFLNKFQNLQVDFAADPVNLSIVSTANAGKAEIKGAEAELMVRPVRSAGIRVTYAYLKPKIKQIIARDDTAFDPAFNVGVAGLFDVGDDISSYFTMPFVPKSALTVSGDWTMIDDGEHSLTAYASYSYQAGMYTSSVAGPAVPGREFWKSDARKVVNVRLAYKQAIDDVDVTFAVFANNLFDRRAREFVIGVGSQVPTVNGPAGFFSTTAPYSEPRVIGAEIKASF